MVNLLERIDSIVLQHLPTAREINQPNVHRMRIAGEIVKYGRPACLTYSRDRSGWRQGDLKIKACGSYCSLSPARPLLICSKSCQKTATYPKSAFPPIGGHGANRQVHFRMWILGKYRPTVRCQ